MARQSLTCIPVGLAVALAVAGCSAGSQEGAYRGAKTGAVGGVVAGAVGSIFWGGDAVNNALRAGAVGAASGAAVGAMSGSGTSPAPQPAPQPAPPPAPPAPATTTGQAGSLAAANEQLRARMGDLNFAAGEELAHCRHVSAISRAQQAFIRETDPQRRSYALLIQAMAAEESSNRGQADAVYSRWGQVDPARADPVQARNEALDGLLKLQRIRQENGLPPLCT